MQNKAVRSYRVGVCVRICYLFYIYIYICTHTDRYIPMCALLIFLFPCIATYIYIYIYNIDNVPPTLLMRMWGNMRQSRGDTRQANVDLGTELMRETSLHELITCYMLYLFVICYILYIISYILYIIYCIYDLIYHIIIYSKYRSTTTVNIRLEHFV